MKELFNGKTELLTTGEATSAASTAGYFVMVRDTVGRFPDSALWGDGWGWAFFSADDTINTVTKDYRAECLACHEPARSTDLIYDHAYPVLRRKRPAPLDAAGPPPGPRHPAGGAASVHQ